MKYKGSIVGQLSGSMGGVVASNNRYGTYFRRKVAPVNRNTASQRVQREALAAVSQLWRSLDTAAQAQWASFGEVYPWKNSVGDSVKLSGQAAFCSVNTFAVANGGEIVTVPPVSPDAASNYATATAVASTGVVTITWNSSGFVADGGTYRISYIGPIQPGRNYNETYATLKRGAFGGTPGATLAATLPGSFEVGQKIKLQIIGQTPDGRRSVSKELVITLA